MWFWFFIAVVAVVAGCIWEYRRKAAGREAASKRRLEMMLKAGPAAPAPAGRPVEPDPAPAVDSAAVEPVVTYAARERLLTQPETLIYLLLKSGLPDHSIFPKISLATLVEAPGTAYDREQQLRRLSRQLIDFVVCDKSMRFVAAVQLTAQGAEAVVAQRIRAECLKSAGLRLVTIDPQALPKRADIRAVVCGNGETGAAGRAPEAPQRKV